MFRWRAIKKRLLKMIPRQCFWCGRFKVSHRSIGPRLPLRFGWSHGPCRQCINRKLAEHHAKLAVAAR